MEISGVEADRLHSTDGRIPITAERMDSKMNENGSVGHTMSLNKIKCISMEFYGKTNGGG